MTVVPEEPGEDDVEELLRQIGNYVLYLAHCSAEKDKTQFPKPASPADHAGYALTWFVLTAGQGYYLEMFVRKRRYIDDQFRLVYY